MSESIEPDVSIIRGISGMTSGTCLATRLNSADINVPELSKTCRRGLKSLGIDNLFPVQRVCTKLIGERLKAGHLSPYDCDICVSAATGQGKTLAYLLPIVNALSWNRARGLQALIVLPTRDLALQVASVASSFAPLSVQCFVGKQSMSDERKMLVESIPDIAIATIGRLIDHLVVASLDLSHLQWLVVDEADRMLSTSDFDKWSIVLNAVPETTQRLLFSATMTSNPLKLNKLKLNRPLFVSVGHQESSIPQSITHRYIVVPNKSMKVRCLLRVLEMVVGNEGLDDIHAKRCLIFCRTTENVQSLSALLKTTSLSTKPFSANLSAQSREKLLDKFASGQINVLVSTDVITRGIDIPDIDLVINYDVPLHTTTYIHRAGRTGRAGKVGHVVTMCEKKEMRHFRKDVVSNDTVIKNNMKRYAIDFRTVMKHSELEAITAGDTEILGE
jgi:superfamily II DNA/RNA helicase